MANAICGNPAAIADLDSLPIPHNINLMAIPGLNASYPPMVTCCQPNPVHVDNCTLWCEIPKSYFNNSASHDAVQAATAACLRSTQQSLNSTLEPYITAWQFNSGIRVEMWTVKEMGVLVLALSGLMYML
jgi:hypothetical protein